ncbi:hypothetical protein FIBSPDRAFT_357035 [Athelia psychrophila]|uniref:Uncharacterized protein n=1 Tax=Athelia psychrophila TaxID=1759441 RepID=A0A166PHU3_9AGAM|nr:hypothetical protein FIBSPDRAFT_357035 [Fibularhizoctonia sp. CBS 109695]
MSSINRLSRLEGASFCNDITISSLPPEILAHIFSLHRNLGSRQIWSDMTSPSIRVSHVSRMWRDTALSMPWLWTVLTSPLPRSKSFIEAPSHTKAFYDTMVARSKDTLLGISIQLDTLSNERPGHTMLVEIVISHAHRLGHLWISAPWRFLIHHMPTLHGLSSPQLTHMLVANAEANESMTLEHDRQRIGRIFTGGAGKLQHFEGAKIGPLFQPPLCSLTSMTLFLDTPVSYGVLCSILSEAAPALVQLHMLLSFIINPTRLSSCATMPVLATMTIISRRDTTFATIEMIRAPSLRVLDLLLVQYGNDQDLHHQRHVPIYGSTADRYPSLDELRLRGFLERGLLAPFPTITQLIIDDIRPPTELHKIFDPQQPGFSSLLPGLRLIAAPPRFDQDIQDFFAARMKTE